MVRGRESGVSVRVERGEQSVNKQILDEIKEEIGSLLTNCGCQQVGRREQLLLCCIGNEEKEQTMRSSEATVTVPHAIPLRK